MPDDKPRIRWSATEIVGIGIDNPERVRKTEDGKTVLMPTTFTIKSTTKITKEDLLNDDPIWPFEQTRPSDVAEEIMKTEDERILATALGASKDLLDGPTTEGEEGCPSCGSPEADAMTPRTVYACGSSDYDQRPGTFSQKCGGGEE